MPRGHCARNLEAPLEVAPQSDSDTSGNRLSTSWKTFPKAWPDIIGLIPADGDNVEKQAHLLFLQFTAPLWVVIFGYFILKETVTKFDILAILFIFLGMGLFFIDELSFYGFWGNITALISGVCFALVTVLIRKEKDYSFEIVLFGNAITALICFPFIFTGFGNSSSIDLLIIFALGIFQLGIPYLLYTKALKYVKAIDAILTGMIEPVLNPLWVFLFIGEVMGEWAFVGGSMVLIASLGRVSFNQKVKE